MILIPKLIRWLTTTMIGTDVGWPWADVPWEDVVALEASQAAFAALSLGCNG